LALRIARKSLPGIAARNGPNLAFAEISGLRTLWTHKDCHIDKRVCHYDKDGVQGACTPRCLQNR